ncbi:MAG TPA: exodeoxyribonuclease VII large subunit [Tepidisphaeraceae bacterium]|nr:exodeoxyribonuclease VII large subunit [Tepidisphaeraceae bacterium]
MAESFFEFHQRTTQARRSAAKPQTAPSDGQVDGKAAPLTVTELTAKITRALTTSIPQMLSVRGQVSNFKIHAASGHAYFTLKDVANCVECRMWDRDFQRLKFQPEDGIELVAGGKIGVYGQRGRYQLNVVWLHPIGQGALELAFRQLRLKLESEALFDPERKKPLPPYPRKLALVTSAQAAALHDMLKVLRRCPWIRLTVYAVPVQGDGAAPKIAAALAHLNKFAARLQIDAILLARGGGSLEDLWAFNEEAVARAIAASTIPIITGIGHEVDVSIADLVADHHAHTPTEAAQVAIAQWREAATDIEQFRTRLSRAMAAMVQDARQSLRAIERHETFRRPMDTVHNYRQFLDDRQRALSMAMVSRLHSSQSMLRERSDHIAARFPRFLQALREKISGFDVALQTRMTQRLARAGRRVAADAARLACHDPRQVLQLRSEDLNAKAHRLERAASLDVQRRYAKLTALERQLESISPRNVLQRGYTLTYRKQGQLLLKSQQQIKPGDRLVTHFADGQVESVAQDTKQLPLFE